MVVVFMLFFSDSLSAITPDDGSQPVVTADNRTRVENTLRSCVLHCQKRLRARKQEEEAYRVARDSVYGWKTERVFSKDAVFEDEDLDNATPWWQKPELSKEKKAERMKQADREVKFELSNKTKNNRDEVAGSSHSDAQYKPKYYPYSRETRRCRRCHIIGHLAENCRISDDRIKRPSGPRSDGHSSDK